MAQINTTVGDLQGNAARFLAKASEASAQACELLLSPELLLTGYPPQDLLFDAGFVDAQLQVLHHTVIPQLKLPAVVGFVERDGDDLFNAAAVIINGRIKKILRKTLLPTYDVFDEWRYFRPADENLPVQIGHTKVGVTICEDIWDEGYDQKVVPGLAAAGAELLVNISSSPFHSGKRKVRMELLARHAQSTGLPIAYCNLVGAQDELIFDGESMAVDSQGGLICLGPRFSEALVMVDLPRRGEVRQVVDPELEMPGADVFAALCLGTKDYFRKCGFSRTVIGLSGGIDSSLVAAIAVEALGAENVIGVAMPSAITSSMSNEDAALLADALGIEFHSMSIEASMDVAMARYRAAFGEYASSVTIENLQARERGKILMEISNDRNALVLSTGNKTEYALGYTTLYGDMCGGLAVIGDVSKPQVYELARLCNLDREVIPRRVFERPPSAELREGQVDPFDYPRISPLVELVIEEHRSKPDLLDLGYTEEEISMVQRLVRLSEYKRHQAPPILRVSEKAFGIGRRMPIVNHFEDGSR